MNKSKLEDGIMKLVRAFSKRAQSRQSQHRHYIMRKAWQRSCRPHPVKSRCRHAKMLARKGYRYKGGR